MEAASEHSNCKSALWDRQYEMGKWEILKAPSEEGRYNTLVELTKRYCDNSKILEIGCGEGLILQKLSAKYDSFLGIDISQVAIRRASYLKNEKTSFVVADMEAFVPTQNFDLIIFNESVYYSKDPIGTIKRYMNFLNNYGVVATSIFGNSSGVRLIELIEQEFRCLKTELTVNQRGTWHCHIIERSGVIAQ